MGRYNRGNRTSLEAANTLPQKRLDRYNKNEKLFPPTEYLTRKNKEAKRNDYPSWYTMQ